MLTRDRGHSLSVAVVSLIVNILILVIVVIIVMMMVVVMMMVALTIVAIDPHGIGWRDRQQAETMQDVRLLERELHVVSAKVDQTRLGLLANDLDVGIDAAPVATSVGVADTQNVLHALENRFGSRGVGRVKHAAHWSDTSV